MKIITKFIGAIGIIGYLGLPLSLGAILKPGDELLPFSLQTVDGVVVTVMTEDGRLTVKRTDSTGKLLSRTQPEALLLDFWATWCIPCRAAMPHLEKLYNQLRQEAGETAVEFFGLALDRQGPSIVRPFLQKIKLSYPQLCAPPPSSSSGLLRSPKEVASANKFHEIPVV